MKYQYHPPHFPGGTIRNNRIYNRLSPLPKGERATLGAPFVFWSQFQEIYYKKKPRKIATATFIRNMVRSRGDELVDVNGTPLFTDKPKRDVGRMRNYGDDLIPNVTDHYLSIAISFDDRPAEEFVDNLETRLDWVLERKKPEKLFTQPYVNWILANYGMYVS